MERSSLHEIDLFLDAKDRLATRTVQFPGAVDQVLDALILAASRGNMQKGNMAAGNAGNAPLKDRKIKKKQLGQEKQSMGPDFEEQQDRRAYTRGRLRGDHPT
jgi:hypothetical protein